MELLGYEALCIIETIPILERKIFLENDPLAPYILLFFPVLFGLAALTTDPVSPIYTNAVLIAFGIMVILAFYASHKLKKGQARFYINFYIAAVCVVTSLFCLVIGLKGNSDTFTQSLLWGIWLVAFIIIFLGEKFIPFLKEPRKQGLALLCLLVFSALMMIPASMGVGHLHSNSTMPIVRLLGEKQGNEIITFLIGVTTALMFLSMAQLMRKSQNGDWSSFKENHKKREKV